MSPLAKRFLMWLGVAAPGFVVALALDGHPLTWADVGFAVVAAVALVSLLTLPYAARR